MVSLASLPRDVLLEIFSYFCLHCRGDLRPLKGVGTPHQQKRRCREPQQPDQKSWYSVDKYTLFSLAASCKSLHAVAEDILYHDFAPGYGDSELSELYTFGNRLNQFMRTVGSRKDLAGKVRFLFVHPKHSNGSVKRIVLSLKQGAADLGIDIAQSWRYRAEHFMKSWTPEQMQAWGVQHEYQFMLNSAFTDEILEYPLLSTRQHYLERGLDRLVSKTYSITANNLYRSLHHELIPMLIAMLPKLSHIIYTSKTVFEEFQHTAFDDLGVTKLPHLRTLELDRDLFSILKRAPNLEQLDIIDSFSSGTDQGPGGDQSMIRTLRLENTSLPAELGRRLSFAAKDLRSFVVESSGAFPRRWVPADAFRKLCDYRHSLETLHLDLRCAKLISRPGRRDSTFRDFGKLQHVFLNTRLMFHISPERCSITGLLPPSIVSLHLAWDGLELDPNEWGDLPLRFVDESVKQQRELSHLGQALLELASVKAERFQDLKHIGIDCWDKVDAAVQKALLEAGIGFVPESWPSAYQK
ncbi:uncharacterized protein FTJAE_4125 [Fusarium tjaetaba]|uniref:Uncharacterized protein n=1 Tax=Fusarium tjaetaba TaxID=1567544 RepID=A0A8H5RXE5_9HYPO|nr:uncharacterized protein FTJAE_4125 [Fusarium tjaetaba]KAF5641473.1 hypothetical protein FTJAE_4125 [Fusarium tjaetaba]